MDSSNVCIKKASAYIFSVDNTMNFKTRNPKKKKKNDNDMNHTYIKSILS